MRASFAHRRHAQRRPDPAALLPRRTDPQPGSIRDAAGHRPGPGLIRPHRPAPAQPPRRPSAQPGIERHRRQPHALPPAHPRLRPAPPRRRQDRPGNPPPHQALPSPPHLTQPQQPGKFHTTNNLTNIGASFQAEPSGTVGLGRQLDLLASSPWRAGGRANLQHRTGAPSNRIHAGAALLLRGQGLKDQGILGGNEIAERYLVKRKLPEERENPVVVDLRSAWQGNLLNFPAARLADRVADLPDQFLLGVVFEARWDGERADRAHRYVLDPAILAHRFVRPFSDQDTRVRNRPGLVNLLVQLLEDLLLGAVIHASRNVDVGDGHRLSPFLVSRTSDVAMKGGDRAAASSRCRSTVPPWRPAAPVTRDGRRSFGQPLVGPVP